MYSVNSKFRALRKYFLRVLSVVVIISISIALATCDSSSSSGPTSGNNGGANSNQNEVRMVGQSFSPANIEVQIGTTVTWTNESDLVHTVTSGTPDNLDDLFDSGEVSPGEEFSYIFNQTGTFNYFCIPHAPSMTGSVTVRDADTGY